MRILVRWCRRKKYVDDDETIIHFDVGFMDGGMGLPIAADTLIILVSG